MHGPEDQPNIKPARQAALNNHAKALTSGNPKRQQAAVIHLGKMKLNAHEQNYLHQRASSPASAYAQSQQIMGRGEKQQEKALRSALAQPGANARAQRNAYKAATPRPTTVKQDRQFVQQGSEFLTGYQEIKRIRQDPLSGGIALAGILPFGKAARGLELGVDAARGVSVAEKASRAAQTAEQANGIRKVFATKNAARLAKHASRRGALRTAEEANAHALAVNQISAERLARGNKVTEMLPGEHSPPTGGEVGAKVREAMRGTQRLYGKQRELRRAELTQRFGALRGAQEAAPTFKDLAAAQRTLKGELPRVPFKAFEALRPHLEEIRSHIQGLDLSPPEKNRLTHAILGGVEGKIPTPSERKLIERAFGREVKQLSTETIKQRGIEGTLADIANVPRALIASGDLSGTFRQNLAAITYKPSVVFKGYQDTLKSALSESAFQQHMATDVHGDPLYALAKEKGKVQFTEIGADAHTGVADLNTREETVASNWAEHLHEIPGIRKTPLKYPLKAASAVVRGSDRNYVLLLNRTRMRLFNVLVHQAAENGYHLDGPHGDKLVEQIGGFVNSLTGRGDLGKYLGPHRAIINSAFFSPGLMKSRLDFMNPVWYLHAEPFVRQQRLKAGLRLYGTIALVLLAAKMAGAKVGTDPTNADFAKIRIGNTRMDVAGGFQQYFRLLGQLAAGHITSSTSGKVEPISNSPFHNSYGNVGWQFLRNKLAPIPAQGANVLFGPSLGQKMTPKSVAANMFIPLLWQDMYQIEHATGPGGAVGYGIPDLFGVGVQNYGAQTPKGRSSGGSFGGYGGGSSGSFGGYGGSSGSSSFGGYGP